VGNPTSTKKHNAIHQPRRKSVPVIHYSDVVPKRVWERLLPASRLVISLFAFPLIAVNGRSGM
jgi:hypothetical protein